MANTLIIKNADFSTNAVATVTFDEVECTGIEFDTETYTITGYDPVEIDYTVTPSNTTDPIVWASSDTDIITVSGGTMTIVGVGTCTVTATCGEYSATATVTVSLTYIPNWDFSYLSHPSTALYATISASMSRLAACGSAQQAGTYNFMRTADPTESHPVIILPKNTASITISRSADKANKFTNGNYSEVFWMSDEPCGNTSYPTMAKFIAESDLVNFYSNQSINFEIPEGANAFGFFARLATTYTDQDVPNTIANDLGLTITFNPASN